MYALEHFDYARDFGQRLTGSNITVAKVLRLSSWEREPPVPVVAGTSRWRADWFGNGSALIRLFQCVPDATSVFMTLPCEAMSSRARLGCVCDTLPQHATGAMEVA